MSEIADYIAATPRQTDELGSYREIPRSQVLYELSHIAQPRPTDDLDTDVFYDRVKDYGYHSDLFQHQEDRERQAGLEPNMVKIYDGMTEEEMAAAASKGTPLEGYFTKRVTDEPDFDAMDLLTEAPDFETVDLNATSPAQDKAPAPEADGPQEPGMRR